MEENIKALVEFKKLIDRFNISENDLVKLYDESSQWRKNVYGKKNRLGQQVKNPHAIPIQDILTKYNMDNVDLQSIFNYCFFPENLPELNQAVPPITNENISTYFETAIEQERLEEQERVEKLDAASKTKADAQPEVTLEQETITKEEAIKKLKEAKELRELEVISKEKYDAMVLRYQPILLDEGGGIKQPVKAEDKKTEQDVKKVLSTEEIIAAAKIESAAIAKKAQEAGDAYRKKALEEQKIQHEKNLQAIKNNTNSPIINTSKDNIFKTLKIRINNEPWLFLVAFTVYLISLMLSATCCFIPIIKVEYMENGFSAFFSWGGVFILMFFIVPFIISFFSAFKMISHFVQGKPYPNGQSPYSTIPFLSLMFYLVVGVYILYYFYVLLSIPM